MGLQNLHVVTFEDSTRYFLSTARERLCGGEVGKKRRQWCSIWNPTNNFGRSPHGEYNLVVTYENELRGIAERK